MGCGASKGTNAVPHNMGHEVKSNDKSAYSKNDPYINQFSSEKIHNNNENGLPPPRPPDQSLEELLKGKEDLMKKMDEHANHVSFDKATTQNLSEFTEKTLIPKDTVVETETAGVNQTTTEMSNDNLKEHNISEREFNTDHLTTKTPKNEADEQTKARNKQSGQPTPISALSSGVSDVDAAELLLEKYKRENEKAKNLMMVDKMRHDITLQDKLAKRREMKRKAALAQGNTVVTETREELSNEDTEKRQKDGEETGEAGTVDSSLPSTRAGDGELSAALSSLARSGDVETGQDKHDAVMAETAPMPIAPETRKEAIYGDEDNIELFKEMEDFAINMKQISSPTTTFAVLMKSLYVSQLSDLEKVRILFHWITKQNLDMIIFPNNIDEDTPMGFLFAIKHESKTYAELFSRLCSAAGLHAKVIFGCVKGVGYLPDYKFKPAGDSFRSSWNAVLINGQWRLIDTHWGSRHITENDGGLVTEQKTTYAYEEFYFLTNPDQLITTHFPDEEAWQLLPRAITLKEFENSVKVWPLYYKLKLELYSHVNGLIQAPQDGVVELRVKTSGLTTRAAEFNCHFMTKDKKRDVGKHKLASYKFYYVQGQYQVFQIYCPADGEYIVKLFAKNAKFSDEDIYTNIALYQINCTKLKPPKRIPNDPLNVLPYEVLAPFPETTYPWGPPVGKAAANIAPFSHGGPIITTDKEGEATLIMQPLPNKNLKFLHKLYVVDKSDNLEKQELENATVHFTATTKSDQKVVVFKIRTPSPGNYSLTLLYMSNEDGFYTGFCSYLVISRAQSKTLAPAFPFVGNGNLGTDIAICQEMGLHPMTLDKYAKKERKNYLDNYGDAWLEPNEENRATVTFYHSKPLNIVAEIESAGKTKTDLSRRVIVEDTGRIARIIIHPPKYTAETPEYVLKLYAGLTSQPSGLPMIYTAFVNGAKKEARDLPQCPIKKWGQSLSHGDLGVSLDSIINCEPLFGDNVTQDDQAPCRLYKGGNDVIINFSLAQQLTLKSSLSLIKDDAQFQELDECFEFFTLIGTSEATLKVRIPKPGDYCLTIFGSNMNKQLYPFMYILLSATSASASTASFPRSFATWLTSFVELHAPMNKNLKRNTVNYIKVSMANVLQTNTAATAQPYSNIFLIADMSTPVSPTRCDTQTNAYEWDYAPGPGEKVVSLVVQKNPEKPSLSCVLQFDVVG